MGLDEAIPENFHIIEVGPNYKADIWSCARKTLVIVEGDFNPDFGFGDETTATTETETPEVPDTTETTTEETPSETEAPVKNIYKIQVEKTAEGKFLCYIVDNAGHIITNDLTEEQFNSFRSAIIEEYFRKVLPENEESITKITKGPKTLVVDYETEDGSVNLQINHLKAELKEYTLTDGDDVVAFTYFYYEKEPEDFPVLH